MLPFDKLRANGNIVSRPLDGGRPLPFLPGRPMDHDIRLKRLRFRAWHRGTREADLMIGGFFDAGATGWSDAELDWFERLLEEQDVDIMGWAIGSIPCPPDWDGAMMQRMRSLDFVKLP